MSSYNEGELLKWLNQKTLGPMQEVVAKDLFSVSNHIKDNLFNGNWELRFNVRGFESMPMERNAMQVLFLRFKHGVITKLIAGVGNLLLVSGLVMFFFDWVIALILCSGFLLIFAIIAFHTMVKRQQFSNFLLYEIKQGFENKNHKIYHKETGMILICALYLLGLLAFKNKNIKDSYDGPVSLCWMSQLVSEFIKGNWKRIDADGSEIE